MCKTVYTFIYNDIFFSSVLSLGFALAHRKLSQPRLVNCWISCLASKQAEDDDRVCLVCTAHCGKHETNEIHWNDR